MYFIILGEDRRARIGLADHQPRPVDDLAVADDLERLVGDVDGNVVGAGIVLHPAPALEIGFDLADAIGDRHVHDLKRRLRDDAVIGQPVARLEALDRLDQRGDRRSRPILVVRHRGRRWRQDIAAVRESACRSSRA